MDLLCLYDRLLRLYPKDYQYRFSREMRAAFEERLREAHEADVVIVEIVSLARGAITEWASKLMTDPSIRRRHLPDLRMMRLPWVPRQSRRISCWSDTSR